MKGVRLTLIVGAVLVSASPAFSQFVKAALGFRLGYSPTERGYGQKPVFNLDNKKAIGLQLVNGVNSGGWNGGERLQTAASSYGTVGGGWNGIQNGGSAYGVQNAGAYGVQNAGSAYGVGLPREGPLQAHVGHGAVRHLKILGLNLYLGGKAAHSPALGLGHGHNNAAGGWNKAPLAAPVKKPFSFFPLLHKPLLTLPQLGFKIKPTLSGHASPHSVGGGGGLRANFGTPGYGVGFNLGYRQGINFKGPLAYALGLAGKGWHGPRSYAPHAQKAQSQNQLYYGGDGGLKGNEIAHSPIVTGHNTLLLETPIVTGLESKQHMTTQTLTAQQQAQMQQVSNEQQQTQASQNQPQIQQQHQPAQHQGVQGPFHPPARPSIFNLFGLASHNRPSILRPSQLQYTFNNPQPLASSASNTPVRMVVSHHPPTPAPANPRNPPNEVSPQAAGWSTLFSVNSNNQQTAASNNVHAFVNPLPPNGQSLAKLQASLRGPVASAQNQIPYYQHAPQFSFQGFPPRGGLFSRNYRSRSPFQSAPQFTPSYSNLFQQQYQLPYQQPQHLSHSNSIHQQQQQQQQQQQHTHQSLIPQQSLFLSQQQAPVQLAPAAATAVPQQEQQPQSIAVNFPRIPFTTDSLQFAPDPSFQYSHTISSQPVNMGTYTMNMDLSNNNSGEQAGSASSPVFGPGGRRIKKLKRARQDIIIKKQDSNDEMEASATNAITMASSLGATQWTPIVFVDIPKITRKSIDVSQRKPVHEAQEEVIASASVFVPSVVVPEEHNQDRSMILKKRRLGSSAEMTSETVIPSSPSSSSTTTTSTTTSAPPPASSTSLPEETPVTTVSA